jgi:hypothetical protein
MTCLACCRSWGRTWCLSGSRYAEVHALGSVCSAKPIPDLCSICNTVLCTGCG